MQGSHEQTHSFYYLRPNAKFHSKKRKKNDSFMCARQLHESMGFMTHKEPTF